MNTKNRKNLDKHELKSLKRLIERGLMQVDFHSSGKLVSVENEYDDQGKVIEKNYCFDGPLRMRLKGYR